MLAGKEKSGYEIWKQLSVKGIKERTNYLYMLLAEMQRKELLSGRWVGNPAGPRRHHYSLGKKGEDELKKLLAESVEVVMDAFVNSNLSAQNMQEHVESVRGLFRILDFPCPRPGERLVLATPPFDPLICYPLSFQAFIEASTAYYNHGT